MIKRARCLTVLVTLCLSWGNLLPAAHADDGMALTLITSLHRTGPDQVDGEGTPAGWPSAQNPAGVPLYVQGANGEFLYVPTDTGIVRVAAVPAQYQIDPPFEGFRVRDHALSNLRPVGSLVQRGNGDLVGAAGTLSDQAINGVLYRMDFDGTHGTVIESTAGQLASPNGVLVADGDIVYGMDEGRDGQGRIFRLNADDSLDILYQFPLRADARTVQLNGMILGSDGLLYGLMAVYRGAPFSDGTLTLPGTETGMLFSLDPARPDQHDVLHVFTLAHGEMSSAHPINGRGVGTVRTGLAPRAASLALNWVVEGQDDWLYGNLGLSSCDVPSQNSSPPGLPRRNPMCGLSWNAERFYAPSFPYYDVPEAAFGAVYRVRRDGSDFQILHRFDHEYGATPRGPMVVLPDGTVLGTTLAGGQHESVIHPNAFTSMPALWHQGRWVQPGTDQSSCVPRPGEEPSCEQYSRDGVLFSISPDQIQVDELGEVIESGVDIVLDFQRAQSGKGVIGLSLGANGVVYGSSVHGGGPWLSSTGVEHYADAYGTIFAYGGAMDGSVTLTLNPPQAMPGEKVELTWATHLVRDCVATSSAGDWTGLQIPQGSIDLYKETGLYTYSLVCIDEGTGMQVSSGAQTLRINTDPSGSDGNVIRYNDGGAAPWFVWFGLAALLIRRRRFLSHSVTRISYLGGTS